MVNPNTPRLGLIRPDGPEFVNVDLLNSNSDVLDVSVGVSDCTAATRPVTNLFDGRIIYETDTGKVLRYDVGTTSWVLFDLRGLLNKVGTHGQVDCAAAFSTVLSLAVPVILNRWYRVTGFANASQITLGNSISRWQIIDDQGGVTLGMYKTNIEVVVGTTFVGTGIHTFKANSTRNATVSIQGAAGAGALRFPANTSQLTVEDLGTGI